MSGEREDMDLDLMLVHDGELGADQLEADEDARLKLRALDEIGEVVRGYVELSTDATEDRLAGLWERVSQRLEANGHDAAVRPRESSQPEPRDGLVQRFLAWLQEHRGHFVTGAVSATAVALILLAVGPRGGQTRVVTVPPGPVQTDPVTSAVQERTPPEVESLEVYQGSGTILTVPGDDGEGSTSVIWLAPEDAEETMEGPI